MAPYYASIWALIEEKGIKCVITTRKKAREFFLKKIVAVDGLNQGHNGGRAPATFAEQRNRWELAEPRGAPRTPTAGLRTSSAAAFSRRSIPIAAKKS